MPAPQFSDTLMERITFDEKAADSTDDPFADNNPCSL